jgi:spermidine synthase
MSKLTDFLSGHQKLTEIYSPINGKLVVRKNIVWGTYIQANGFTQSGGVVRTIWKNALHDIRNTIYDVQDVLILGLGGGTVAQLIHTYYPNAKITGVDIDPLIVNLGKKYLNLDRYKVKIKIEDAFHFLTHHSYHHYYNLILVDLYQGDQFPEKFESGDFLVHVHKLLANDGVAIFNRLYCGNKRSLAMKFLDRLEKAFPKVEAIYPEANIVFLAYK